MEIKQVTINGEEYVPKTTVISKESLNALGELYWRIWTEAHYDAYSEQTREFAGKLWPHIEQLQKELRFRH